jgi:hypothetical protein
MPKLPGAASQWGDTLRRLIARLTQNPEVGAEDVALALGDDRADRRLILSGLARAGVLERGGSHFVPTEATAQWCEDGDPALLMGALHTHVRYVGEMMGALAGRSATHQELLELARNRFGLRWDSPGPVRERTNWLRALGLGDLFDGRMHLTPEGQRVHALLVHGAPQLEEDGPSELPVPPLAIAALLERLDQQTLRGRSYAAALYVPGGQDDDGRLEALRILTEAAMPSLTDGAYTQLVLDTFVGTKSTSSAKTARDTAKALGLIRRISSTAWTATEAGAGWVATDHPVDLARVVHAHVFYFGEILHDLDTLLSPTAARLADRAIAYGAPSGRALSASAVKARLDLLLACGLVTKTSHSAYGTTALGRSFRDTMPCLRTQDTLDHAESDPVHEPASQAMPALAEALAAELETAAHDSASPERLEGAAIEALTYLGMPGKRIGGSSNPDGQVRAGIGVHSRVLAVETKSSATGRVTEQPLFGLPDHRAKIGADITLLIGPGFDRRLQEAADDDPAIAVILTDTLAEAVRAQALTPLTPAHLQPLIDPSLHAGQRVEHLREAWNVQLRRVEVERTLVDILINEAEDPLQEGGWLDVPALRRELRSRGKRATPDEVTDALAFLASPRIAVVERSNHGYRAIASADTAFQRMQGLGQQWASQPHV